jgi:hypothetical protein
MLSRPDLLSKLFSQFLHGPSTGERVVQNGHNRAKHFRRHVFITMAVLLHSHSFFIPKRFSYQLLDFFLSVGLFDIGHVLVVPHLELSFLGWLCGKGFFENGGEVHVGKK